MSSAQPQSNYEKSVAAVLVVGMAAAGWGPFVFDSLSLPFIERFLLPVSLAFAVIALGLIYDAAERLLGSGRGLYAAAMFCTIPATGIVSTNPGMLPETALMMVGAVGIWMASRAQGEERPYFLGFIVLLLAAAGYSFGFRTNALAMVFVVMLAAKQSGRATLWIAILSASYLIGGVAHEVMPFTLPVPKSVAPEEAVSLWRNLLPLLPWAMFVLPAIWMFLRRRKSTTRWWLDAAVVIVLTLVVTIPTDIPIAASAAALAPMIGLLAADMVCEDFRDELSPVRKRTPTLPAAFTVFALFALPVMSASGVKGVPLVTVTYAAVAVILANALAWTISRGLPRWSFMLLFGSGIFFGRLANQSAPLFEQSGAIRPVSVSQPTLLMMIGAGIVVYLLALIIVRRAGKHTPSREYLYGGESFRSFDGNRSGTPVRVSDLVGDAYSFVIFGDITGAESAFTTRRGGFLAFRALIKRLQDERPAFSISLGDLASQATRLAYQRMGKLIRQISVPLAVTPGNHDLFAHSEYDVTRFHEIFGVDNAAFRVGPVQFAILNNAWGSLDEQQFTWLEQSLKTAPFTLLFCHKPPFDLRPDGNYAMEDRDHAARLHRLLRAKGVSAVFSGHIHSLLAESRDGVTYVISGGAGSKLTSPKDQYHYLTVQVSATELIVRAFPLSRSRDSRPLLELRFTPRS